MTIFSKHFGEVWPLWPPWLRLWFPGRRFTMGAPKSPNNVTSRILPSIQYIGFRKTSGSNTGAPNLRLPLAHSSLYASGYGGSYNKS